MAADSPQPEALIDIAVLDDDLDFRNYMEDVLKDEGAYIVRTFAHPEDLFTAKLKTYRSEFDRQLAMARAATPDPAGSAFIFSVPLERG